MVDRTTILSLVSLALSLSCMSSAYAQEICGDLRNSYGPYDYRTEKVQIEVVENHHFLPFVENLTRGNTSGTPGGDIDYTLRASPNHHRALLSMMNLSKKEKLEKPRGSRYTVACWLDRAERFAPNDAMVKTLYGIYLMQKKSVKDGANKLEEALAMAEDNANIHYNLGLAYFDLKDYDKALASAHKAYQLGFQFPGLRTKLEKVGKWRDLPPKVVVDDQSQTKQNETATSDAEVKMH